MKSLWNYVEGKNWPVKTKYRAACWMLGAVWALIGFALWLIIRSWALSSWGWMFCFIGYPVLMAKLAVFTYSCSHDLHNGSYCG